MIRRSTLAFVGFILVAGCASSPAGAPVVVSGTKADNPRRIQTLVADCMKQRGFKYVAWVPKVASPDDAEQAYLGDYEAMKKERSQEGFGVFVNFVHPEQREKRAIWRETDSPNFTIKNQLSPTQRTAYGKALTACRSQALKQVTGKVVTSDEDWAKQENEMIAQRLDRDLNADPKLVELATAMGDCLKGKGHQVTSARPVDMSRRGGQEFEAQKKQIALNDDIPDTELPDGQYYEPRIPVDTAKQYLNREIKAAVDDLECGKDFYAAYLPRSEEIVRQVEGEFGKS
ncbi:hypothetical protein [Nonomuraea sp. NEAU-A123]|uniref:hypothetical protein n=1 Tax=Nonomuraea sp. NEAU-A123 TaxID=2839649 RepID=UPI001BE431EB|nr:hypothetical protein [Nonomuraea sp. NEAU-A123]MBT2224577.1 hypothetical protein [Nonomuraea sp. NEAU-A123]